MNTFHHSKCVITLIFMFIVSFILGQSQYTKYDDIPGNLKSYKPAFQEDYPEWAKMLFSDDLNFHSVKSAYEKWDTQI